MSKRADLKTGLQWPTRMVLALMAFLLATSLLPLALSGDVSAQDTTGSDSELPAAGNEVIVVLDKGEDPQAAADAMGVEVTHIYTHVFNGFAGTVREQPVDTTSTRASRKRKPKTKQIALDGPVAAESQLIPTGVSRAGVPKDGSSHLDITPPVAADIAVIDSGISPLSDLAVYEAGSYSCL
ncbi:MAG: hypothetical protein KC432_00800, partial [Thermomicrobiales bacterium]|nr:hypothetical protein [Thermomicrobiales bacterium]